MSENDESVLTLHLRPATDEWGSTDDDRWRQDLADLDRQLRRALPDEVAADGPGEGRKGAAELTDVILALGSGGVVAATTEVIKAWIGARPGRRMVEVDYDGPTGKGHIVVKADGLGARELADVATKALPGDRS
jgi:hypothetical protein